MQLDKVECIIGLRYAIYLINPDHKSTTNKFIHKNTDNN